MSGRIGKGVVIARLPEGGWSGPSAIGTGGAGFGFQVGGRVTEFVIILNTQSAVHAFARGGNVEFGGALSVAAGPVGRAAEAGILPVAAVYTYSRSQGLFAGASLEGTILVAQSDKKSRYYGGPVTPEQILAGRVPPPPSARPLVATLSQYESEPILRISRNSKNRHDRPFGHRSARLRSKLREANIVFAIDQDRKIWCVKA